MRNVMITGCASGIGLATAKKFIQEGYNVCGMSRRKIDSKDIIDSDRFHYFSGDISSSDDRKSFLEFSLETMGNIDILINVAGVAPKERNDILSMTEESYDYVMDINTKGTLFMTQIAANEMIKNTPVNGIRGYILNTSSISAYTSSVNRGEYCISKAGVSMITTLFADRLSEYGIMVNETRPGVIKTDMTSTVEEKYSKLIEDGIFPIRRWGYDEDLAETAFTLCTGKLPYMTGQVINVDGGFHIRRL